MFYRKTENSSEAKDKIANTTKKMNTQELIKTVTDLEAELRKFERDHDMDDMRKKRNDYYRLRRTNRLNTLHPNMLKSLRSANTVIDIYRKKNKLLVGWRKKLESISNGCQNCTVVRTLKVSPPLGPFFQ